MEKNFTFIAEDGYRENKPSMSIVSSGCFVSLIWGKNLFTANVGDSFGGIARRLATHAVKLAAEKAGLTYSEMMLIPEGNDISGTPLSPSEPVRPLYHDDITVTVVYLDITKKVESKEFYCYKSHSYNVLPSGFEDD
ncbi:hypothetical protein TSUD_332560 [Trifolium subterraneum]|uniref:PPM-type phosphatase domain-containing protein n=1 Tax=Trifolium subterraneum TaxID=3900 RepID=A0A2Z6MID7_TRISU|nr:hypothetical protein TSUD_332560 [Trifolium subterraneum]